MKLENTVQELIRRQKNRQKQSPENESPKLAETAVRINGSSSQTEMPGQDALHMAENDLFLLNHRLSSSSHELCDQLQEVLNEKIRSLHSSKDEILVLGSPSHDKKVHEEGKEELSNFSPGCETCFSFSPKPSFSPEEKSFSFISRPCDNQLTFISPFNSNSCSSQDPNPKTFNDEGSPLPSLDQKTSQNVTSVSGCKRLPKTKNGENISECVDVANPADTNCSHGKTSNSNRQHSEGNSNGSKEGFSSSVSDRTVSPIPETFELSPNDGNSTLSESKPIYSPPSRSSFSTSDKRCSFTFSHPSDPNFSFSFSGNEVLGPISLAGEDSNLDKKNSKKSSESLSDTVASIPTDKKTFDIEKKEDQLGDSRLQTRKKEFENVPDESSNSNLKISPQKKLKKSSPVVKDNKPKSVRDKRLSYFKAIEQGNSKGRMAAFNYLFFCF